MDRIMPAQLWQVLTSKQTIYFCKDLPETNRLFPVRFKIKMIIVEVIDSRGINVWKRFRFGSFRVRNSIVICAASCRVFPLSDPGFMPSTFLKKEWPG